MFWVLNSASTNPKDSFGDVDPLVRKLERQNLVKD